jgi:hypothetical protein
MLPSIKQTFIDIVNSVNNLQYKFVNENIFEDHILHVDNMIEHLIYEVKNNTIHVSFGYVIEKEGYSDTFEIKMIESEVETKLLELYDKENVSDEISGIISDILKPIDNDEITLEEYEQEIIVEQKSFIKSFISKLLGDDNV